MPEQKEAYMKMGLTLLSMAAERASICACDADGSKVMVVLVFSFPLVWFVSLLCSAALHERDDFQRVGALELRLRTLGARHDLAVELHGHAVGAQTALLH